MDIVGQDISKRIQKSSPALDGEMGAHLINNLDVAANDIKKSRTTFDSPRELPYVNNSMAVIYYYEALVYYKMARQKEAGDKLDLAEKR
jgi:hypothetical protein